MDLQEVRWGGMEWNDVAQVVNACEFIHLVVCLTTGPKPLPKRVLHIV